MSDTRRWLAALALAGVLYAITGVTFSALSRDAGSDTARSLSRLGAWAISAIVYAAHIAWEQLSRRRRPVVTAWHAALGVALGAFLLAVAATVHSLQTPGAHVRSILIALPVWPVLTGLPAFLVAWAAAAALTLVRPSGAPLSPA